MMMLKEPKQPKTNQIAFFNKVAITQGEKVARIDLHFVSAPKYIDTFYESLDQCYKKFGGGKNKAGTKKICES